MPDVQFNTYYRYDDLPRILKSFAEEYPKLVRLESIGKSYESRDVWLATVTNVESGADKEKPALGVDGNIHASEVSPTSACLYLLSPNGGHVKVTARHERAGTVRAEIMLAAK